MATINATKNAGHIIVSATSTPTGNSISIGNISETWATKSGSTRVNISANTGSSSRSFTLNVTATTTSTSSYPVVGSASSAWTVNQVG